MAPPVVRLLWVVAAATENYLFAPFAAIDVALAMCSRTPLSLICSTHRCGYISIRLSSRLHRLKEMQGKYKYYGAGTTAVGHKTKAVHKV